VDLEKPMQAVKELDRAVKQLGFKALRVIPWLWGRPPNDKHYYPLYVKCIELGIPFCTQVGHTGPLMPSETGRPVPYLDEVALTFPELTIVGGHIGHPWTEEMIGLAWKHERVYIDTSAYLPAYYPEPLIKFMNSYGKDKVLFGTNFPQLALDRCASGALELKLKPEARAAFLYGNARRVFGLGPVSPLPG
jgi:predicted TIM-barrel fold metal-dependent hydrolase